MDLNEILGLRHIQVHHLVINATQVRWGCLINVEVTIASFKRYPFWLLDIHRDSCGSRVSPWPGVQCYFGQGGEHYSFDLDLQRGIFWSGPLVPLFASRPCLFPSQAFGPWSVPK